MGHWNTSTRKVALAVTSASLLVACNRGGENPHPGAAEQASNTTGVEQHVESTGTAARASASSSASEHGKKTLEYTYEGESYPIETVLIRDVPEGSDQLVFYSRPVTCETVRDEAGEEGVVLLGEIDPGLEAPLAIGPVPVARWTWYAEPLEGKEAVPEAAVSIVRVGDSVPIEGTVTYHAIVDDEDVELEGPFTATVCEVPPAPT